MKRIWTIVVMASFLSVLSGSFIAMAYGNTHAFICLATRLNGSEAPCPESDPIGFANFHGGVLRNISNLTTDSLALLLTVASLGIIGIRFISAKSEENLLRIVSISEVDLRVKRYSSPAYKLSWFSLHENSPSIV